MLGTHPEQIAEYGRDHTAAVGVAAMLTAALALPAAMAAALAAPERQRGTPRADGRLARPAAAAALTGAPECRAGPSGRPDVLGRVGT